MFPRPATSFPGAALLCGLLLLLTSCGKSEPSPSVCETHALQCAEGMCADMLDMLPYCSMEVPHSVDTFALPRETEVLTPGSHERMLERRGGHLVAVLRYLRIEAVPDQWYRFSFECDPGVLCNYELLDGRGKRVGELTGRVEGERVVQVSEAQPLYVAIRINTFSSDDRAEVRYRYVLETIADDHGADPASFPELQGWDVRFEGKTDLAPDVDAFHVQLREGQPFHVACVGPTASSWVLLRVTAPDGTELYASSPDGVREARQAGLHAVWVRAGFSGNASSVGYQCRFRDLSVDDYHAEREGELPLPAQAEGWFEHAEDVDPWRAQLTAGHFYRVRCEMAQSGCAMQVVSPDGTVLSLAESGTQVFRASASGAHRIELRAPRRGSYTLTLEDGGLDDHGDSATGATPIQPGQEITGVGEYATDVDAFAFDAEAGRVYQLTCQTEHPEGSWGLRLFAPDESRVDQRGFSKLSSATVAVEAAASGRYVARVSTQYSTGGSYRCSLVDLGTEDLGDVPAQARQLTSPASVEGRLETRTDADVFRLEVEAAHLAHLRWRPLTPAGARLRWSDAEGRVLAEAYGSGTQSLDLRVPAAGPLFVSVEAYDTGWGATLPSYVLEVEDRGLDDHGDTLETATALPLDTWVQGWDQGSVDKDTFQAEVVTRGYYRLTCMPQEEGGTCAPYELHGPRYYLGYVSYGTSPDRLLYAYESGAAVFGLEASGRYAVKLELIAVDDHWGFDDGTPLQLGVEGSGVLEVRLDTDPFRVELVAGQRYRVVLEAPFALAVSVTQDVWGTTPYQGGAGTGTFTAAVTGTHRVDVSSTGALGEYRLRVEPAD